MTRISILFATAILLMGCCFGDRLAFGEDAAKEQTPRPGRGQDANRRDGDLRIGDKLKVGDPAPDFELKTLDGKSSVKLSDYKDKQPVVLIFGSYT